MSFISDCLMAWGLLLLVGTGVSAFMAKLGGKTLVFRVVRGRR